MPQPKDRDWLNGYKNKTPIYVVYKKPRVPNRIDPRQNTPRHILIKLTKIKHTHTKTNIKSSKGKTMNNTQEDYHKDNCRSFDRNSSGQERMARHT